MGGRDGNVQGSWGATKSGGEVHVCQTPVPRLGVVGAGLEEVGLLWFWIFPSRGGELHEQVSDPVVALGAVPT